MYFPQANETQDPSDMSDPSEVNHPHHVFVVQGPAGRYIQLPWYFPVQQPIYSNYAVDPNHQHWIPAPQYGNAPILNGRQSENDGTETESNVEDDRSGAASFPPPGVGLPAASTMQQQPVYQLMPPFSNVYVGNIPSGVSVQGYINSPIPYPPHPFPGIATTGEGSTPQSSNRGGRSSGKTGTGTKLSSDKCGTGSDLPYNSPPSLTPQESNTSNDSSPTTLPPTSIPLAPPPSHPPANFVPLGAMPYSYSYFPQAGPPPPQHITSAQHATGSPLYIPHPSVPMYHAPMYNSGSAVVFSSDNGMSHSAVNVPPVSVAPPLTSDLSTNHNSESGTFSVKESSLEETYKNSNLMVDSVPFEPESQKHSSVIFVQDGVKISNDTSENNSLTENNQSLSCDVVTGSEKSKTSTEENYHNNDNAVKLNEVTLVTDQSLNSSEKISDNLQSNIDNITCIVNDLKINTETGSNNIVESKELIVSNLEINSNTKVSTVIENINNDNVDTDNKTTESGFNETQNSTPESIAIQDADFSSNYDGAISKNSPVPEMKTEINEEQTPVQGVYKKSWASLFKGSASESTKLKVSPNAAKTLNVQINNLTSPATTYQNTENNSVASSGNTFSINGVSSLQFQNKTSSYKLASSSLIADDTTLAKIGELLKNYKLDHRAVNFEPRGLENRSNYCYINAILQALLACPPFYNLMKCISHNLHNSKTKSASKQHFPIIDSMVQFVDEFKLISQKARRDKVRKMDTIVHQEIIPGKPFEPICMYNMLSVIQNNSLFSMGQQEDAQEFLTCLLNGLNDEMVELIQLAEGVNNGINSNSRKVTQSTLKTGLNKNNKKLSNGDISTEVHGLDDNDSEWKQVQSKIKPHRPNLALTRTPLSDIFRGQMRSRLQKIGDQTTNNIEPFFTLHLNIEKASSVREALELLVGRDALEGVTSSRTNQEVDAWQQQTLEELPYVLLLHLKYFDYKHHTCTKIMKSIEFPIDLKLELRLISSQSALRTKPANAKSRQYKLFAVVYHDGKEASKGHYITDVFHIGYGGWIRYDDSRVCTVSENDVLHPKIPRVPYLLYYRRCDTIAALMQPPFEKRM